MLLASSIVLVLMLATGIPLKAGAIIPPVTVKGKVTDSKGDILVGVSIKSSAGGGTSTDINGNYSINTDGQATLTFTYVGFNSQSIKIGGRTVINVTMGESASQLDEVVVVGYGTQKRRDITGSVASVDLSQVANVPNINVTQALSGSVAGLSVTPGTRPGTTGGIYIRGISSISNLGSPMIVLDGIIFPGNLSDIPPDDIAGLEVLKDASALAIYGSRAAKGVILITTKKGASDKPKFDFSTYYGSSNYINKINFLSPERYLEKLVDYKRFNDPDYKNAGIWSP